jgi:hypothetical protein
VSISSRSFRESLWASMSLAAIVVSTAACGNGPAESSDLRDGVGTSSEETSASLDVGCSAPSENCPCDVEGLTVQCNGPKIHQGNYTSCLPGVRVCMGKAWGACVTRTLYQDVDALTQDYTSPCAPGTHVRWGALTLQGFTPDGSQIDIGAQTSDTLAGLDAAPSDLVGAFDGDASAPWENIDVGAALSTQGIGSGQMLRVTVRLVRASPSAASPSVMSWQQASSCVPQ